MQGDISSVDAAGAETADGYGERVFGAATFSAFDPLLPAHRAAAAALYDRLVEIGFGPQNAAALFGLRELALVRSGHAAYYDAFVLRRDAAGNAARFFVLHEPASDADLREWLGEELVRFLAEMVAIAEIDGAWRSLISATWFADRLVFADARAYNVVWPVPEPFSDFVMPPGGDSVGLERVAPRGHRRAALDLCCGPGTQALAAAAYSERVVGVDVNPRALRFARFNAAANRIDGATFVLGDCYAPLDDGRFDVILANPPFVPWPESDALLFRGGGPLGDDVLARILAGAVDRLEPRGSLAVVADFANSETLPARIEGWQRASRRTLILLQSRYELIAYAESHAGHLRQGPERETQVLRLLQHFVASGIRSLDFGYVIQDGEPGSTHVVRTAAAQNVSIAEDVAGWFAHQQRLAHGDVADLLLEFAPGLSLVRQVRTMADGSVVASRHAIPGPASLLAASDLSEAAFALLERVSTGNLRPRDVAAELEARELAQQLDRGMIRLQTEQGS